MRPWLLAALAACSFPTKSAGGIDGKPSADAPRHVDGQLGDGQLGDATIDSSTDAPGFITISGSSDDPP